MEVVPVIPLAVGIRDGAVAPDVPEVRVGLGLEQERGHGIVPADCRLHERTLPEPVLRVDVDGVLREKPQNRTGVACAMGKVVRTRGREWVDGGFTDGCVASTTEGGLPTSDPDLSDKTSCTAARLAGAWARQRPHR